MGCARVPSGSRSPATANERPRAPTAPTRDDELVTFIPAPLYAQIERSIPIVAVDFVPTNAGRVGLILRESPFGQVWCHVGGRILFGETIEAALRRQALTTLGVDVRLGRDPQPDYVYQWFPPDVAPTDGTPHGDDPRKHSLGLAFAVELEGEPHPAGEALDFAYFEPCALPTPLWPGTRHVVERLCEAAGIDR